MNGRLGELRQPPRDLGLADAGRPDHQDVLGRHLLAEVVGELLAAPAVAQRHGDGALGVLLADDVAVELGDDLARGEVGRIRHHLVTFRAALIEAQHHQVVVVESRHRPEGRADRCRRCAKPSAFVEPPRPLVALRDHEVQLQHLLPRASSITASISAWLAPVPRASGVT